MNGRAFVARRSIHLVGTGGFSTTTTGRGLLFAGLAGPAAGCDAVLWSLCASAAVATAAVTRSNRTHVNNDDAFDAKFGDGAPACCCDSVAERVFFGGSGGNSLAAELGGDGDTDAPRLSEPPPLLFSLLPPLLLAVGASNAVAAGADVCGMISDCDKRDGDGERRWPLRPARVSQRSLAATTNTQRYPTAAALTKRWSTLISTCGREATKRACSKKKEERGNRRSDVGDVAGRSRATLFGEEETARDVSLVCF